MREVIVDIVGTSPYSQSRQHDTDALDKERKDDYELRTWREKSNYDDNGIIYIPAMAFKQCMDSAAKKLSMKIPGQKNKTFTKFFVCDVVCSNNVPLGVHKDKVQKITINAHANGVRGSGTRVKRFFPIVTEWSCSVPFTIMDDTVTKDIFEETFSVAARSIGIGRFRPENGGLNGRFNIIRFNWL